MGYELTIKKDNVVLTSFGRGHDICIALTSSFTISEDFAPFTINQLDKGVAYLRAKKERLLKQRSNLANNIKLLPGAEFGDILDNYFTALNDYGYEIDDLNNAIVQLELLVDICETPSDYDNWSKKPKLEWALC